MLSHDKLKFNSYIDISCKTLKSHLNTLKNDFYIDDNKSRYYSLLEDNLSDQDLDEVHEDNSTINNFEINKDVLEIINNSKIKKIESLYFLDFLYHRYKTLSFIPFALFQIGNNFLNELEKLRLLNEDKKNDEKSNIQSKSQIPMKAFKNDYLNEFCNEISDDRRIKETCFELVYNGIIHFVPYLETEVIENLLFLSNDKKDDYLNYAIDKIKKTPFAANDNINIDKWLKKYNVSIEEFPNFNNVELKHWLGRYYNGYSETPHDLDFILDLQIDFYCYAAMTEANKMIKFIESKRTNVNNGTNKIESNDETDGTKQLTVNQAIILLDKLGLFSSMMFENLPNTKKAILISHLIGKNDKNIKSAIEKLELKPNEIPPNYQKDIDKIERILSNLE
jgi:hypothetical protein